jgi:DNA-binding winged helix-turn-helix (wHTH) protein
MAGTPPGLYRFGPFCVDREKARLTRDDHDVPLSKKPFDLLCYLIEHRARVVLHEELVQAFWPEHPFESDEPFNLRQQIRILRRVLADPPHAPRFIATVRGRGYRFIGEIDKDVPSTGLPESPRVPTPLPSSTAPDEVTASIVSFQRQLDTILGIIPHQALSALLHAAMTSAVSRGYAAPETERMFTLARLLCQEGTVEHLPQLYFIVQGLCNAYTVKGQLRTAQRLAHVLCAIARRMPDAVALITARVTMASILGFSGQFARAASISGATPRPS